METKKFLHAIVIGFICLTGLSQVRAMPGLENVPDAEMQAPIDDIAGTKDAVQKQAPMSETYSFKQEGDLDQAPVQAPVAGTTTVDDYLKQEILKAMLKHKHKLKNKVNMVQQKLMMARIKAMESVMEQLGKFGNKNKKKATGFFGRMSDRFVKKIEDVVFWPVSAAATIGTIAVTFHTVKLMLHLLGYPVNTVGELLGSLTAAFGIETGKTGLQLLWGVLTGMFGYVKDGSIIVDPTLPLCADLNWLQKVFVDCAPALVQ